MSYDLQLNDPVTGEILHADSAHHMRGGTYCVGGTTNLELNVTYNYGVIIKRVMLGGLALLDGSTGSDTILALTEAIDQLGDDVSDDYWEPTEGNVKRALTQLKALAQMRPDGIWQVH